jgi:hypothetical protein
MALRSPSALPITGRHEDSPEVGEKSEYVICVAALRGIFLPSQLTHASASEKNVKERHSLGRNRRMPISGGAISLHDQSHRFDGFALEARSGLRRDRPP